MGESILAGNNDNTNKSTIMVGFVILFMITLIQLLPLTLNTINNASGSTTWLQNSKNDFEQGTLENTVIIGSGNDAELRVEKIFNWTEKLQSLKPAARVDHPMVPIYGEDKVMLYGGYDGNVKYKDTWVYDFSSNTWTSKNPPSNPGELSDHEMAAISDTDKAILYNPSTGGTWEYDLSQNRWLQKAPEKVPNEQNHEMATIYGTDQILLFGGGSGNFPSNATWIYDSSLDNWSKKTTTNVPPGRWSHAMASIYGTDKVLLFGGRSQVKYFTDTWIYDQSENSWTEVVPNKSPSSRGSHDMATIYDSDCVAMFGGNSFTYDDRTWVFDLSENTWMENKPTPCPGKRDRLELAMVWGTNQVVLFGGWSGIDFDDTWVFKYGYYNTGIFLSKKFDTSDGSAFTNISWEAETPEGTFIEFQLRTADTSVGLYEEEFVGPNGKTNSYYDVSPSQIWSGHYNKRWVQYKAYLNSIHIETPKLKMVNITFNNLPHTILNNPIDDSFTGNNTPAFSWDFNDLDSTYQQSYQVLIDNNSNFDSVNLDTGEQVSTNQQWSFTESTSFAELPDGTWYWKVRTKDSDGDWGLYSDYFTLNIDTTVERPLNVTVNPDTWVAENSYTVSWENPEDFSGILGAYYKLDSAPISSTDGTYVPGNQIESIEDVQVEVDGVNTIYIWLKDRMDNINYTNYGTAKLFYDTTGPPAPKEVSVTPNYWTSNNSFTVDWIASEDVSEIKDGVYFYIGILPPTAQKYGAWTNEKPFTISDVLEGENKIYLWLEDQLGNRNFQNHNFGILKYDPKPPTISHTKVVDAIENEGISISAEVEDQYSGIYEVFLHFKKPSESIYDGLQMTLEKESYVAIIPKDKVTPAGLEYYIKVMDHSFPNNTIYFGFKGELEDEPTSETDINIRIEALPGVLKHSPISNNILVNTSITIEFNMKMEESSTENAFSLFPYTKGKISWVNNRLIFKPDKPLAYNSEYTVSILNTARDIRGYNLKNNFEWTFTTGQEDTIEESEEKERQDAPAWLYGIVIGIIIVVLILIFIFIFLKRRKSSHPSSHPIEKETSEDGKPKWKLRSDISPGQPQPKPLYTPTPPPQPIYSPPPAITSMQQPHFGSQQAQYTPQQTQYTPQQTQYTPQQTQYPPQQSQYPPQQSQYPPQQTYQTFEPMQVTTTFNCEFCNATITNLNNCPYCGWTSIIKNGRKF